MGRPVSAMQGVIVSADYMAMTCGRCRALETKCLCHRPASFRICCQLQNWEGGESRHPSPRSVQPMVSMRRVIFQKEGWEYVV